MLYCRNSTPTKTLIFQKFSSNEDADISEISSNMNTDISDFSLNLNLKVFLQILSDSCTKIGNNLLGQVLVIRNANPGNIDPHVWPDYALTVHDNVWQTVANIEFTNENLNHINAAEGTVIAGGAGAGFPYVIPA
ncbi:hypothetical protein C1646_674591 [Rhizophagus diaphanus]|nr:hypothetical protein C1646_674591 [Rhizophagus diaphanus] [Rhizophagus sp. MUCL 43196]